MSAATPMARNTRWPIHCSEVERREGAHGFGGRAGWARRGPGNEEWLARRGGDGAGATPGWATVAAGAGSLGGGAEGNTPRRGELAHQRLQHRQTMLQLVEPVLGAHSRSLPPSVRGSATSRRTVGIRNAIRPTSDTYPPRCRTATRGPAAGTRPSPGAARRRGPARKTSGRRPSSSPAPRDRSAAT